MTEKTIDTLKKMVKEMEDHQEFLKSFEYIIELRSYNGTQWSYVVEKKGDLIAGGSGCSYETALEKIEQYKKGGENVKHKN